MSKITKKGRNPGAVDCWLDSLGLYRKNVAYDETCLFRAISEQLFGGQVYHERVRRECIAYARENFKEFTHLGISKEDWSNNLNELERHMVVCGDIELNIISKKYNRDIIIFDAAKQKIFNFTKQNLPNAFFLCLLDKDHFDVVYKKDHIINAGFCQSIIYKILYEEVFGIPDVDDIVNKMLYDKNIITQAELDKKTISAEGNDPDLLNSEEELDGNEEKCLSSTNIAPFPFKVAKALDPNIYRNIEYDSWGEVRRELRLGDWYYGDNKLILGTKCIFNDSNNNEKLDCYIQEFTRNKNECVIYITKLAEKRVVDYSQLSPEDDAKPWPLPYRFMKNLNISSAASSSPPVDKVVLKPKRRNKDKKRTKSESSIVSSAAAVKCETVENFDDYVGIPLQMHNPNEITHEQSEVFSTTQTETTIFQETPLPPQQPEPHTPNVYNNWEPTHWQPYLAHTPDPFVWPQSPMTTQNTFNFKPMVASAPVTPNVVPYHDQNYPFYYNYQVEPYQTYPQWSSPTFELQPPPPPKNDVERTSHVEEQNKVTLPSQQENPSHTYCPKKEVICSKVENTVVPPPQERIITFAPQSPSVEIYHPPMISYPPGTPMIYAPTPPEMTEMMMPMTPVMYTEIPHVSPTPFIYPPTPPTTWYPAGVTPQGFIFPPRRN